MNKEQTAHILLADDDPQYAFILQLAVKQAGIENPIDVVTTHSQSSSTCLASATTLTALGTLRLTNTNSPRSLLTAVDAWHFRQSNGCSGRTKQITSSSGAEDGRRYHAHVPN